ncbi:hypothetical protein Pan216_15370 [Planctomycetes bacterium Pan216]|uniref:Uncharacterized protein n=1 Tax=Kolteria novifilia TaxID=2527975 RepID=A0A518B133_9BACT|nr:hypothetical protein Pan216_15370 [Planctomycetes bacterium Pan216]
MARFGLLLTDTKKGATIITLEESSILAHRWSGKPFTKAYQIGHKGNGWYYVYGLTKTLELFEQYGGHRKVATLNVRNYPFKLNSKGTGKFFGPNGELTTGIIQWKCVSKYAS